jgi:hypothetical protein
MPPNHAGPPTQPRYTGGSFGDAGFAPTTATVNPGYAVLTPSENPATAPRHGAVPTTSAPTATLPTRSRTRERRSRPATRRRTRKTTSGRSPDDPDSPGDPEPPPLPYRIAGPAGDDSAVAAAFLQILNRRHSTRWEMTA